MNMGAPMGVYPNQSQGYGASGGWSQPMSMNGYVPYQAYYQPGYQQAYQNGNQTTVVTQQPRTYMPESPWYSAWQDNSGYTRYAWQPIGNGIDDGGMSTATYGGQPTQGAYPQVPPSQNQEYYYTPTQFNVRVNFDGLRNYLAQHPQQPSLPMPSGGGGFDLSSLASMFGTMMGGSQQQQTTSWTMGPGPMPPPTNYAPGTYPAPYSFTQSQTASLTPLPPPQLSLGRPVATAFAV